MQSNYIRESIRSQIRNIIPLDHLEQEHITDAFQWIDSGEQLFRIEKPDKPPKHLVSYFVLIDSINKSVLLVDHIKAKLWLPTGGHVELNEDPKETVKRECLEELGKEAVFLNSNESPLFITVTETAGLTARHIDVSLWFVLEGSVNEQLNYDTGEFNAIRWFAFEEVLQTPISKLDPHMYRFIRKLV